MSQAGLARVSQANLPPSVPLQFTGDNGTIAVPAGNNITIYANNAANNSGSSFKFFNSGSTSLVNVTDVLDNTCIGNLSGSLTQSGDGNTCLGDSSGKSLVNAGKNCFIGAFSGQNTTSGGFNTALGYVALANNLVGEDNTAVGYSSLLNCTGDINTGLGFFTLQSLTSGDGNIAIGNQSGANYTTESFNICIQNAGTVGDSSVTRIGSGQAKCFISGITSVTVSNSQVATINATDQLGQIANGTAGFVLTSNGASSPTFQTISASGAVTTLTGDSGGALSPTAGNFNILGLSGSKVSGAVSTLTVKSPPFSQVGASATCALNTGEIVTTTVTRTLPASAGLADGDLIIFYTTTAGALTVQAVGTQKIRIGNVLSSAAGTIVSTDIGDSISLRFDATQGFWLAVSVVGNWTLT